MSARAKKSEPAEKRTVILVHGLRGDHHGLLAIAKLLQPYFRVLTPDLPGYGDRPALDNQTIDGYVEWLHDYVKRLKLVKPIIIGHSMGSIVASHFVAKYPNACAKECIFLSPIFRTSKGQKRSNRCNDLINFGLHLLPRGPRYRFLKSKFISLKISHFLTYDRSQKAAIDEQHVKYSGRFISAQALMNDISISMRTQTVVTPEKQTLCIMGQHDRLLRAETAKAAARKKHFKLIILHSSGHLINYERPDAIVRKILKFLGETIKPEFDDFLKP